MSRTAFSETQMSMARYLRDPDTQSPPAGVEERRLKIYRDLIYNNIEGFISGGFPVLRSLYTDEDWHSLVRLFIDQHRCHTPYFLEISQEFIKFLMEKFQPRSCDPAFLLELAHYEWVELALDVSEEELPEPRQIVDPLAWVPCLSPLAWVLSYHYPVHRIGPEFQPDGATPSTYLAVYRNRADKVQFMELNAATARLLELVRDNDQCSAAHLLATLAAELGLDTAAVRDFGADQLLDFVEKSVVLVAEGSGQAVAPVDSGG